jgi:hypothetical protein
MGFNVYQIAESKFWKDEHGDLFMEVPITGVFEDRQGDTVTREAGDSIIRQLKSGTIPLMSDHGTKDAEGKRLKSWKEIMGKWIDGRWSENNVDVLATSKLNKANPDALLLYEYGMQKMPLGFSISGNATVKEGME